MLTMKKQTTAAAVSGGCILFVLIILFFTFLLKASRPIDGMRKHVIQVTKYSENATLPPRPYEIAYKCTCEIRSGGCFQEVHSLSGNYKYRACEIKAQYSSLQIEKRVKTKRAPVANLTYSQMKKIHNVLDICLGDGRDYCPPKIDSVPILIVNRSNTCFFEMNINPGARVSLTLCVMKNGVIQRGYMNGFRLRKTDILYLFHFIKYWIL